MTSKPRRILYCNCTYARVVKKETKAAVLEGLVASNLAFDAVPDLCELAARRDPALERLAAGGPSLDVVACYPRAVRWLFHAAGAPLPQEGVRIHNMRTEEPAATLAALRAGTGGGEPADAAAGTEAAAADDAAGALGEKEAAERNETTEETTP